MSKSSNNIKAFFEHLPSPSRASRKPDNLILPATPVSIGDGFTEPELRSKDSPNSGHWQPQHDYEDVSVGELSPGPRRVSFTARVVNLYHQNVQSKMRHSARGCLKVLVKDDSALILVCVFGQLISVVLANSAGKINLWYAESVYHLCLGDRVTIWTTHVSSASIIAAAVENTRPATLMTSIFPERDAGCHLEIEDRAATDRSTCNTPLGYVSGRPLHGLMSLKDFMDDGGAEVPNAKILVCVKVIGSVSTCQCNRLRALAGMNGLS